MASPSFPVLDRERAGESHPGPTVLGCLQHNRMAQVATAGKLFTFHMFSITSLAALPNYQSKQAPSRGILRPASSAGSKAMQALQRH